MAGFNAADEVEEITYDFNPYLDLSGTVPEPSGDAVDEYRRKVMTSYAKETSGWDEIDGEGDEDGPSDEERALSRMDEVLRRSANVEDEILAATADLTGIAPKSLRKLPARVRRAFVGYIAGLFLRPEG